MLYFERIDFSEEIDVDKIIKRVRYLLILVFLKFQRNACNRCHDLLIMFMKLSDIAILSYLGVDISDHALWAECHLHSPLPA